MNYSTIDRSHPMDTQEKVSELQSRLEKLQAEAAKVLDMLDGEEFRILDSALSESGFDYSTA